MLFYCIAFKFRSSIFLRNYLQFTFHRNICIRGVTFRMDNLHYRLNFNPSKTNKIFYHSSKQHLKISIIAKFGCKMLEIKENIALRNLQICI